MSRLWWVVGPMLVVLTTVVVLLAARPVPYRMVMPGSAWPVENLITVTSPEGGIEVHADVADGDLVFLTVSVRRPAGIEAIYRLFDDKVDIVPEKAVIGSQSRDEAKRFNLALMTASKDKSTLVALNQLGYDVEVETTGAVVIDMAPDAPVAQVLSPGDTVVSIDDEPVDSAQTLVDLLALRAPGDVVELGVDRLQGPVGDPVKVTLAARPNDPSQAMLGVTIENRPAYNFPVEVTIDSGSVGGPSAGLAFTLAIIDLLSEGDLTGGTLVAVTGTMELDGTVGPVGGVRQKTETAIRAGAELFIVPPDELELATTTARGRIEVRAASNIDEALALLEEFGGDPVPTPQS